jgi:signal peptidase I
MRKVLNIILIILGTIFGVSTVFGQTDILKAYNIPTTANEPGIKFNSKILVSNLVSYENGDFVCYEFENDKEGKHIRVHRLLGKSGDVVEIRNGILFINETNFDKDLDLRHIYYITQAKFDILEEENKIDKNDLNFPMGERVMISIDDSVALDYGFSNKIKIENKNLIDKSVKAKYNKNWNFDNFGPLQIPDGKCFVIGDNRHNSEDSRIIGLINESSIVGTVVKK